MYQTTCEQCRHWHLDLDDDSEIGLCRRYPPKLFTDRLPQCDIDQSMASWVELGTFWPATFADDSCGEWKQREP